MPPPEPGRASLIAGGVALGAVLIAGLLLVQVFVQPGSRTTVARLVAAAVLAVVAVRARRLVDAVIARQPRSGFDHAGEPAPRPRVERSHFDQLHDEIRFSARSERYFEYVLWPRLRRHDDLHRSRSTSTLEKPPGRSFGRGPSLETLARLVATIEAGRRGSAVAARGERDTGIRA